jgi:hypothetical protein
VVVYDNNNGAQTRLFEEALARTCVPESAVPTETTTAVRALGGTIRKVANQHGYEAWGYALYTGVRCGSGIKRVREEISSAASWSTRYDREAPFMGVGILIAVAMAPILLVLSPLIAVWWAVTWADRAKIDADMRHREAAHRRIIAAFEGVSDEHIGHAFLAFKAQARQGRVS